MLNKIPHIAIVGAGQLGSRHLQALKKINCNIDLSVVEPDSSATETAKLRFDEMPFSPFIKKVKWVKEIQQIQEFVDVAIIATNADIRRNLVEQFIKSPGVGNLILEKVVFQSIVDFESIIKQLDRGNIKAWVNCTRRMYPIYQKIKAAIEYDDIIYFHINGRNWGLGCNCIHYLDLFAFITGNSNITLDGSGLDKELYDSKRNGFIELGGYLIGQSSRGDFISLVDYKTEIGISFSLNIVGKNFEYFINEMDGVLIHSSKKNHWEVKKDLFKVPFQSELTHLAVQDILEKGICSLTTLKESSLIHRPMLDAFNQHLSSINQKWGIICPIT